MYAKRVVVADETYFATMVRNSPYCDDTVDTNNVFLLFDRWENEKNSDITRRDTRKCLHPNPDHCGRSPMTLTSEFKRFITMSRQLFARKFDPSDPGSMDLVSFLESIRDDEGVGLRDLYKLDFGGAVMLATKRPRQNSSNPSETCADDKGVCRNEPAPITAESLEDYLCVEIMKPGHKMRLAKCEPSLPFQWLLLGPCTDNTDMHISDGGCATAAHSQSDMLCQITSTSKFNQACVDVMGENINAGSKIIAYECTGNWNQLFRLMPDCSISVTQPDIVSHSKGLAERVNMTMCLRSNPMEKGGYELTTSPCQSGEENMEFKFIRKDGSLVKTIKSSLLSARPA